MQGECGKTGTCLANLNIIIEDSSQKLMPKLLIHFGDLAGILNASNAGGVSGWGSLSGIELGNPVWVDAAFVTLQSLFFKNCFFCSVSDFNALTLAVAGWDFGFQSTQVVVWIGSRAVEIVFLMSQNGADTLGLDLFQFLPTVPQIIFELLVDCLDRFQKGSWGKLHMLTSSPTSWRIVDGRIVARKALGTGGKAC